MDLFSKKRLWTPDDEDYRQVKRYKGVAGANTLDNMQFVSLLQISIETIKMIIPMAMVKIGLWKHERVFEIIGLWKHLALIDKTWSKFMKPYIENHAMFKVFMRNLREGFKFYRPKNIRYANDNVMLWIIPGVYNYTEYIEYLPDQEIEEKKEEIAIKDAQAATDASKMPEEIVRLKIYILGDQLMMMNLPDTLRELDVISHVREINFLHQLPRKIEKMSLYIDQIHISADDVPKNLTHLRLGGNFNQPIDNLPTTLIELDIYKGFNHPVDNLPPKLKKLRLGNSFDRPINNLPSSLEILILGYSFNQKVNYLPTNLTTLSFISAIDSAEQDYLLSGPFLQICLDNDSKFDQSLDRLPQNLKKLFIPGSITHNINKLPQSLEYFHQSKLFVWNVKDLPRKISHLALGCGMYDTEYQILREIKKDDFPPALTHLKIYGQIPLSLPDNLQFFDFGDVYEFKSSLVIPQSVVTFVCNDTYLYHIRNQPLPYVKKVTVHHLPLHHIEDEKDSVLADIFACICRAFPNCVDAFVV